MGLMRERVSTRSEGSRENGLSKELFANPDIKSDVRRMRIQAGVGFILLLPVTFLFAFSMRWIAGYRIPSMKKMRALYRELTSTPGPIVICSNHLTYIDSCLIIWALASNPWYLFHYRYFTWNVPAADYFKNLLFRTVGYVSKCIFIRRDGFRQDLTSMFSKLHYLLTHGQVVTIFPEGTRSRTGKFRRDRITSGVGMLVQSVENCRVLCLYLRSDKQTRYSSYPPRNSTFYLDAKVIEPKVTESGKAGADAIAGQIGDCIQLMEKKYVAHHASAELSAFLRAGAA